MKLSKLFRKPSPPATIWQLYTPSREKNHPGLSPAPSLTFAKQVSSNNPPISAKFIKKFLQNRSFFLQFQFTFPQSLLFYNINQTKLKGLTKWTHSKPSCSKQSASRYSSLSSSAPSSMLLLLLSGMQTPTIASAKLSTAIQPATATNAFLQQIPNNTNPEKVNYQTEKIKK